MSNLCQVSVVVPILPGLRFSPESLASLENQTFDSLEILLVDGGGGSDLIAALREQAGHFRRPVRWIRDHRQGLPVLRNRGIHESRSRFVAIHNYPDLMAPTRIEEGVHLLESRSEMVLASSLYDREPDRKEGGAQGRTPVRRARIWSQSERMLGDLLDRARPAQGRGGRYHIPESTTLMIRREAALSAGLYDTRFSVAPWATLEFSLRLYEQGSFGLIEAPLVRQVFQARSLTPSLWTRSMEQMDLFYLILAWRYGSARDREAARILLDIREHWLRYWSGWFFRYRGGRKTGIQFAMRALGSNLLGRENWKWALKALFPHSQYPRLFWFDQFIDSPMPDHGRDPDPERILSHDWRLQCF
ncbi:MAG: glycosyltransferase family 2 protein [Nitrospirota bacterium]|nr:glycosyltransferase family 2 protein [Nitrospirota bacterium]